MWSCAIALSLSHWCLYMLALYICWVSKKRPLEFIDWVVFKIVISYLLLIEPWNIAFLFNSRYGNWTSTVQVHGTGRRINHHIASYRPVRKLQKLNRKVANQFNAWFATGLIDSHIFYRRSNKIPHFNANHFKCYCGPAERPKVVNV